MLLVVEACVWRDVKVVGVGNVASLFFGRLCGALSILMAVAWAQASPMAARLFKKYVPRRCLYALEEGSGMPMRVKKLAA